MSDPQHIVIVSPNWLGDAIMALPAIQDVRRRFPASRVTMAARPSVASLFPLVPAVNDVLTLEWKGRMADVAAMRHDVARLRALSAGFALLLTNSFATAWLMRQAGVPERVGYRRDLRGPLLTRGVTRPPSSVHQAAYYQHLTSAIDIPAGPLEPELVVPVEALQRASDVLRSSGWDDGRSLVVLAPGAAYGKAKRWPPSHFSTVMTRLVRERGAWCVVVGSAEDAGTTRVVCDGVEADARTGVIDLTGRTTLDLLAAVLSMANACVSNDSGAMHLAAAAGAPIAALFGPTRDRETAPLTRGGRRADVLINPVWCRPCMLRECPIDHRCMRGLEPTRVFESVVGLIEMPGRPVGPAESGQSGGPPDAGHDERVARERAS